MVEDKRLPDGGPNYLETDLSRTIAEPFNAATATLFILIVGVWAWRLWGRYRQYPFLTACLPVLLVGGIGGTLYHATRSSKAFFLMDVIPIGLLGVASSVYFLIRLRPSVRVQLLLAGLFGLSIWGRALAFNNPDLPRHVAINISYAFMAIMIIIPIVMLLIRTRGRDIGWIVSALALFAIAWMCRLAESVFATTLTMGTHWLWHTFGAGATQCVSEYLYRTEGRDLTPKPAQEASDDYAD